MQEIIYKIDNWTIVKLLGGVALILTAVISFLGLIFLERLKQSWKKNSDKELEELKGAIGKANSTINNLTSAYLNNFHKIQDKRIEASERLWNAFTEINRGIPSGISLAVNILRDEEFTKATLDRKTEGVQSLGELIQTLSEREATEYLSVIEKKIEKYRPFLGDKAVLLFYAYEGFVGRTIYHIIKGYREDKLRPWSKDPFIKGIFKPVLSSAEIDEIYSNDIYSFNAVIHLFETKLLNEIRENVQGKNISIDAISYVSDLEKILLAKRENTGS